MVASSFSAVTRKIPARAYCTVLMILMSVAIAAVQWLVGERKLGRRKAGVPSIAVAAH